jgi:hypothetical protein
VVPVCQNSSSVFTVKCPAGGADYITTYNGLQYGAADINYTIGCYAWSNPDSNRCGLSSCEKTSCKAKCMYQRCSKDLGLYFNVSGTITKADCDLTMSYQKPDMSWCPILPMTARTSCITPAYAGITASPGGLQYCDLGGTCKINRVSHFLLSNMVAETLYDWKIHCLDRDSPLEATSEEWSFLTNCTATFP